jgi:hypothetical protein
LILLILLVPAYLLRLEASRVRTDVLDRLSRRISVATNGGDQTRKTQLEQLVTEIQNDRHGAFRPLTEDWIFRAIAIPFGGAGTLLLIEQLLM